MSDVPTTWALRGAWTGILSAGHFGAPGEGVTVTAHDGLGIASLIVAEGNEPALAQAVKARFGLDLPSRPRAVRSATHALVWAGPGHWLLIAKERKGLAEDLVALSGFATVADQSDSRAALRLSGARIRDALAKGCKLDLHPSAFSPGSAALTSIAYIGVHLWQVEDGPDVGEATFEIMVPRSMAGSFWSWLSASAAEFGCVVAPAGRS
jgi:sarcosine oxidase subunit gamma